MHVFQIVVREELRRFQRWTHVHNRERDTFLLQTLALVREIHQGLAAEHTSGMPHEQHQHRTRRGKFSQRSAAMTGKAVQGFAEQHCFAGRGIGMDVVRSEVQALGGRIETSTQQGRGTSFKLVLPLTTAVTQVVVMRSGTISLGVPANLVELVRRVTARELQQAYSCLLYTSPSPRDS